ncbi:stage 0 sporulation protein, partial [Staphylococcus sp. SIMBA_130]
ENDAYESGKKELPDVGKTIHTGQGKGKVVGLNILERLVQVELFELNRVTEYTLDELIQDGAVSTQATD